MIIATNRVELRRAGSVVLGGTAAFAVSATVLTYWAAQQRFDAGAAAVKPARRALEAYAAHAAHPEMWRGNSALPVNYVPSPGSQLWPMAEHVAVLTSVVAASLSVLVLLALRGRTVLATAGAAALAASAAFAGGSIEPAGAGDLATRARQLSLGRARPGRHRGDRRASAPLACLRRHHVLLRRAGLVAAHHRDRSSRPPRPGSHALATILALDGGIALASFWVWSTSHVAQGAPQAFGYGDSGGSTPPVGNGLCAALVVAALPLGFTLASAARSLVKSGAAPPYRRSRPA